MKLNKSIILILAFVITMIIAGRVWENAYINLTLGLLFATYVILNLMTQRETTITLRKRQLRRKLLVHDISEYYVIFLELSNLNTYSQYYDMDMGEVLLSKVYNSLKKHFTRKELYLYSEDQIVIVQQFKHTNIINADIRYDEQYRAATRVLQFLVQQKFTYNDDKEYDIEAHIGVASLGMRKMETTLNELVRLAQFSMIKSKEQGKEIVVANEALRAIKLDLDSFNKEIESGLKLDEFNPYFHPIIDLTTYRVIGVEALVRWRKNKYRIIEASKFIDIAKEKQLFTTIDKRVIEKTFANFQSWKENDLVSEEFFITINLTYKSLLNLSPSYLLGLIDKYDISVHNIEFDLTEKSLLSEQGIEQVEKLRSHGFRFSVDTFKDRCFSFQHLLDLEIDTIKIDKSKLPHSEISKKEMTFYSSIVQFSKALECKTLSKGIENKHQLTIAQQLNVDYAQGYYFTKPLDDEQIVIYLNKYKHGILSH